MPVAFPLSLRTIIRQGKSRSQPAAFRLSEPRRGYAYVQASGTDTPVFWDITLKFTQPEAALFQLWFTQDLQRGVLEFTMPIRTEFGLVTHTCRFMPDSLLPVQEDGEVFVYTAQIMARAQIIPADAITQYGAAFVGPIPNQTSYAGTPYSAGLAGYWTGGVGPFTYALVDGSLPVGVSLNTSTGVLSGTTTAEGATVKSGLIVRRFGAYGLHNDSNAFSFTAVASASPPDPSFSSVVLLLHFDGLSGASTIVDTSPSPKTPYGVGAVTLSSAAAKFGDTSLLSAAGMPLVYAESAAWNLSGGPWTIEMFAYELPGSAGSLLSRRPGGSTRGWVFTTSGIRANINAAWSDTQAVWARPSLGAWHHYAFVLNAGAILVFVDGTLVATKTGVSSIDDVTYLPMRFGQSDDASENRFNGYFDEVRITKGVARYTASFTPPASPFPNY